MRDREPRRPPPPAGRGRSWTAVVIEVPRALEDELAGLLAQGSLGARARPAGPSRSVLEVYVEARAAERTRRAARRILRQWGLAAGEYPVRCETVEEEPWVERYQARLRPRRVGRRFLVLPSSRPPAAGEVAGRVALRLVPGRAFGTGEHATTRLCVEMLERYVRRDSSWLDLGCGSGILALVAHHCGAGLVCAVDTDAEAVEVAREVIAVNGLSGRIDLRHGSLAQAGALRWDGIVANVDAALFRRGAPELASALADDGALILSGCSVDDEEAVTGALGSAGLRTVERRQRDAWIALTLRAARKAG